MLVAGLLVALAHPVLGQPSLPEAGHYNYESPHANPIAVSPDGALVYAVNTPADTVDVIRTASATVVARIPVGIDPVAVAVRPDGKEVWVSNHVSDSVSVIDADPQSPTRHVVLHTITAFTANRATDFDEPVGIAFAGNDKAYVALSSSNRIAVVDVPTRTVVNHLHVTAQDPRALAVRNNRLYVIPFESNNQTQLSGCWPENVDGELCTFDARRHVTEAQDGSDQSVSRGYVADLVKHPGLPDRDLYVYDTRSDARIQIVDTLGTLLYGIAVASDDRVFIAQADARNDANGKAGTQGHGLAELGNRAFLNRITRVDCAGRCRNATFLELEPLPPRNPPASAALATPFGIAITGDDSTIVATAAASSRMFTMDANTGAVLARLRLGAIPRGIALVDRLDGSPWRAWVHVTLDNSVSLVDVSDPTKLTELANVKLADPSDRALKEGRIAFNTADASSTRTFACASCHPDGHTDQLLWVLDAPLCDPGCDQIQPRLVQDIRGLRGSAPYHWDGTLGDPFGGVNTANIERHLAPNCDGDSPETCTRHLVDATLAGVMCNLDDCSNNDEGKAGPLGRLARDAMAKYLLSVPYPPAPERPYTNALSASAKRGVQKFHVEKQCGNCHRLPFWTMTNMGGSGMDVPSWRGANDRWKNAPQNRFFFADLVGGDTRGFPERTGFTSDQDMFLMIVEGSMGFTGALGRQVTLNAHTASLDSTVDLLRALERSADGNGVVLKGDGVHVRRGRVARGLEAPLSDVPVRTRPTSLQYHDGHYRDRDGTGAKYSRERLLALARAGDLILTVTAHLGANVGYDSPQPTLRPFELPVMPMFPGGRPAEFPELYANGPLHLRGEHIQPGAYVLVDGQRVNGRVRCETGRLPNCLDDVVIVNLDHLPTGLGMHLLQVQNPHGLYSNDFVFYVVDKPRARSRNLIASGGRFNGRGAWTAQTQNATVTWDGRAAFAIDAPAAQPWRVQLGHSVSVSANVQYSLCYSAKGSGVRYIETNVHTGPPDYQTVMGTAFQAEVGASSRSTGASLSAHFHDYHHRFTSTVTDFSAYLNFNLAQSDVDVVIDDVGLYLGPNCGNPDRR